MPDKRYKKMCKNCKKEFKTNHSKKKFCSIQCKIDLFNKTKAAKEMRKSRIRKRIDYTKSCETCGKEFKTHKKNKKYCSYQCSSKRKAVHNEF